MGQRSAIPDQPVQVATLDDGGAEILDAMVSSLVLLRSKLPAGIQLSTDIDIVAERDAAILVAPLRQLAVSLVQRVIAPPPADPEPSLFSDDAEVALAMVRAATDAVPLHISRAQREEALGDAAAIIREAGLERFDVSCHLVTQRDGTDGIVFQPIDAATAQVWSLERLFERAERFVSSHEVLRHERMASEWYFAQWSDSRSKKLPAESVAFTRRVREQEWSFVERVTLALGMPVIEAFVRVDGFGAIPPRQRRLAHALAASIVDVFAVDGMDGAYMSLRSVRDGRSYRVHEHNPEGGIRPGFFVAGRLIPFEQHVWLRSPGAVAFRPDRPDAAEVFGNALRHASATMPLPILIEAMISKMMTGGNPPVPVRAAPSGREAREMLQFMNDALVKLGLRTKGDPSEMPNEIARRMSSNSNVEYYQFAVDEAVAGWMSALMAQASRSEAPGGGGQAKSSKNKRRKKRR